MAENFDGPVVVTGQLEVQAIDDQPALLRVAGPIRPEPAAQFGSHVGVDGNLDVGGGISTTSSLRVVGSTAAADAEFGGHVRVNGNLEVTGILVAIESLHVPGPLRAEPAAQFGGHVGVEGNLDVTGAITTSKTLRVAGPTRAEPAAQFGSHVGVEGNLEVVNSVTCSFLRVPGPTRPGPAAQFGSHVGVEGNLDVTGDIRLVNADCAEEFELDPACEFDVAPGTVVVLADDGCLRHSTAAYDKCVAGVVSGAGGYKPAIVLDTRGGDTDRIAVALMGKVACNVDASYGPVEIGDLLTTSDTPGHAMKANDAGRAFGAVIGKALRPLREGRGLVPILVALQ